MGCYEAFRFVVLSGPEAFYDVQECSDCSETFWQDLSSAEKFLKVLRRSLMSVDVLSLSETLSFVLNGSQRLLKNLRHSLTFLGCFEDF